MNNAASGGEPTDPDGHPPDVQGAVEILLAARHCAALTGAGISAESGVPTFRGKDGLWTKQGEPPPNQYRLFQDDPAAWWRRLKARREDPDELAAALAAAVPNDAHFALAELERLGVLKHTITQNVDGLHRLAGSARLTEIHGNRALLRCTRCNGIRPFDEIPEALPPHCERCHGLLKPDTVVFGEPIPRDTLIAAMAEGGRADCMLLIGTTALVSPAADLAWEAYSRGAPLIEVNLDPTVISDRCAVAIHGKAGAILPRIVDRLKRRLPAAP